jgi:hypothetical protein
MLLLFVLLFRRVSQKARGTTRPDVHTPTQLACPPRYYMVGLWSMQCPQRTESWLAANQAGVVRIEARKGSDPARRPA